ncbi:MAG: hypothetical protein Q9M94_07285 [Candidatus Gracilibacteria bacterium]|nr:hypothetical protein [Candidatus Gracilibacteria bacterium]MDQ7022270.1 hypothetical protein [Candidatus Gracilibacteria bacterium]
MTYTYTKRQTGNLTVSEEDLDRVHQAKIDREAKYGKGTGFILNKEKLKKWRTQENILFAKKN